ncbi:Uncharacterised protein [Moraxella cuniculi]|uniref:Uncharacterized protein n=1 Tax=Moraxella cuniculi TaxID=34061 RepID=A0A3S4R6H5_9GAMM|nr:Uncharacterised protein [Moraxella cuniculi]
MLFLKKVTVLWLILYQILFKIAITNNINYQNIMNIIYIEKLLGYNFYYCSFITVDCCCLSKNIKFVIMEM